MRQPAKSLDDLAAQLAPPRSAWVMLPAGAPTEETVEALGALFEKDDTIIDGGNSFYKDDIRRARMLREKAVHYLDVGTSGGVWGAERGYCMMIGGEKDVVDAPRSDLRGAGAGARRHRPHAEARDPRSARREGLYPCRARGRRPFRQDGPQRHRIRADAGLCRRLRHLEGQGLRGAARRRTLRPRSGRHRRSVAARQRDLLLAARSDGDGAGRKPDARSEFTGRCLRFRRRPLDDRMRRSRKPCRPMC